MMRFVCVFSDEMATRKSLWEHPYDQHYRDTVKKTRAAQDGATKMPAGMMMGGAGRGGGGGGGVAGGGRAGGGAGRGYR